MHRYVLSTAIPLRISIGCEPVKAKGPISLNRTSESATSAQCKEGTEGAVPTEEYTPTGNEILRKLAWLYLQNVPPTTRKEFDHYLEYLKNVGCLIQGVEMGSLLITVKCVSLLVLEGLWADYTSGHLNEVVQKCLVTEDILADLGLAELKLTTAIREDDYKACKQFFQESG